MVETAVLHHKRITVLDKGLLELQDFSSDGDLSVVNAARVSFLTQSDEMSEKDEGLIKFLMRERHGTPFEHNFFKFRVKAPLFVFREWHRHRVGHSYNEWSARYSQLAPEFYIPSVVLGQVGKPGAYTYEEFNDENSEQFLEWLQDASTLAYDLYEKSLELGIAKQQARLFLPVNIYSEMIWTCNARSLMHFLSLRNAPNAQMEIREYAQVAEGFFFDVMPVTAQAFVDSGRIAP
jgi:thymidylate synthase (FAD)